MRRLSYLGIAFGSALVGASLVLVMGASFSSPRASAATQTISVGAATVAVGGEGTVSLQALNMTAPGLGAWSMNIVYNPAIVQLVAPPNGCVAQSGSVCNPAFAANTIRVTGAAASGLLGNTPLAIFTFSCTSVGTSALTVTVDTLADATPGNPRDIVAATSNGSVSCLTAPTPAPPTTNPATPAVSGAVNAGFGPGGSGPSVIVWLVAGLAGAGLAWLSAGLAGAGLAAVTGAEPRRTRTTGFWPRMRPPTRQARGDAQPRSVSPDQMPSARRPDGASEIEVPSSLGSGKTIGLVFGGGAALLLLVAGALLRRLRPFP
jgi:hypothetical protein